MRKQGKCCWERLERRLIKQCGWVTFTKVPFLWHQGYEKRRMEKERERFG